MIDAVRCEPTQFDEGVDAKLQESCRQAMARKPDDRHRGVRQLHALVVYGRHRLSGRFASPPPQTPLGWALWPGTGGFKKGRSEDWPVRNGLPSLRCHACTPIDSRSTRRWRRFSQMSSLLAEGDEISGLDLLYGLRL